MDFDELDTSFPDDLESESAFIEYDFYPFNEDVVVRLVLSSVLVPVSYMPVNKWQKGYLVLLNSIRLQYSAWGSRSE